MTVIRVNPSEPHEVEAAARQAVEALRGRGIAVLPTETVYGVAAMANEPAAVAALRKTTSAPENAPLTLHLPSAAPIEGLVGELRGSLRRLVRKALPGPVSLAIEVPRDEFLRRAERVGLTLQAAESLLDSGYVRVRVPDHPVAARVLAAAATPIVAVSSRTPEGVPIIEGGDAARAYAGRAGVVLDAGRTRYGKPSTIVRATRRGGAINLAIERPGVLDERFIHKLSRWTLLLVCSGNTCRSPMAEGIARQILARERGIAESQLDAAGIRVLSAGAFAAGGSPASVEAVELMRSQDIDLTRHRSRAVTREIIQEADAIYGMTESHIEALLEIVPEAADKVKLLDEQGDIEDPIGGGNAAYRRSAEQIREALQRRLREEQP